MEWFTNLLTGAKNMRITKHNILLAVAKIHRHDFEKEGDLELGKFKSKRSNSQNDYYWAILKELGDYTGYSEEELHDMFRFKYLSEKKTVAGSEIYAIKSTTSLNVDEFKNYIQDIQRFAIGLGFHFDQSREATL
jgi:hypothetical protein